jgi:hypothetical protein
MVPALPEVTPCCAFPPCLTMVLHLQGRYLGNQRTCLGVLHTTTEKGGDYITFEATTLSHIFPACHGAVAVVLIIKSIRVSTCVKPSELLSFPQL